MTRLKRIYYNMIRRCYNNYPIGYGSNAYYRDKGIVVCDEWKNDFDAFERWAYENGYNDTLTIDRIDPNGNYEPNNCQWITKSENSKRAEKSRANEIGMFSIWNVHYTNDMIDVKCIQIGLSSKKAKEGAKLEWNKNMYYSHSIVRKTEKDDYIGKTVSIELNNWMRWLYNDRRGTRKIS